MKLFSTSSKKIHPEKIYHFLEKWNFVSLILKRFLYFKYVSLANNLIRNKIQNSNVVNGRRVLYKTVTNKLFSSSNQIASSQLFSFHKPEGNA